MATSNVIKIDSDYFICSCKSVDELAALKETEGIKSILYLTPDTEQDMGCTPNGFEGVKSVFTDCNSHVALAPSDFAFSLPKTIPDEEENNNRFLAAMRIYADFSRALDNLPRPCLIMCKTNARAGLVHNVYAAVQSGTSFQQLMSSNIMSWHGVDGFVHWAKTVVDSFNAHADRKLIFHQLFESESSTYTYLLADKKTREAVLIDPVLETVDRDFKLVTDLNLKLKYVVNTHVHADHITGSGLLKQKCEAFNEEHNTKRRAALSEGEITTEEEVRWKADKREPCQSAIAAVANAMSDVKLNMGSSVSFGEFRLIAMNTPGHTAGCMSYLLNDCSRVFTGDTLLIRGCGRTDFQEGSSNTLYDSVNSQLFTLPNSTVVWPAHNYAGLTASTIGDERSLNNRPL